MNFFKLILAFVLGVILTVILMPKFIPILHKLKFGQVEREEGLASHKKKNGTPTMGGVVFIISAIIAVYIAYPSNFKNPVINLTTLAFLGYGAIGFLDDWLIVVKHSNKGLPAKWKYLLQSVLAVIFYFCAVKFVPGFKTTITVPVFHATFNIGIFYFILVYFMFTATTNGVNLSDGLDGLATGLTMIAISPYVIFGLVSKSLSISMYGMAIIGALLGFLFFNHHPAKIFMGDCGSLALGGALASLAVFTHQEILLITCGGMFVVETMSVILQVVSFKTTGKRIFKMAPLHHHFEILGWSEQQVVLVFWFAEFVFAILGIVLGVL